MVQALARGGASGIVGATGGVYGSFEDLDHCVMAELFMQTFLDELLSPAAGQTTPLGVALMQAKQYYPFGVGDLCGSEGTAQQDEKTVTEYVLYGVPWQIVSYPSVARLRSLKTPFDEEVSSINSMLLRSPIVQTAADTYSQTFHIDFVTYTVTMSDSWEILTVPGTRLDASDGYPLLPSMDAVTLCLPLSATITGLQVVSDSTDIGSFDIPTVQMLPWEMGGMVYTTTTGLNELYPTPVVTLERCGRFIVVRAMPIQHNPTTGETVFHEQMDVQVTYTTTTPVAACGMRTDQRTYLPGQTLAAWVALNHTGDEDVLLTPTLALLDVVTRTWSLRVGLPFTLTAGEARWVENTTTIPLEEGTYRAIFTAWGEEGREAIAARDVSVLGGRVVALESSGVLLPGQVSQFHVTFANALPNPTFAFASLTVVDRWGRLVDAFSPQVITVTARSTATATFDWIPTGLAPGRYTAAAWVTSRGSVYGPQTYSFQVAGIYLPMTLRDD
jgi:hypothetical protein